MDISAATAKNTEDREHRSSMMAWAAPPPAAPYHQNIVEIATLSMPVEAIESGVETGTGTNFVLEAPAHVVEQFLESEQQEQPTHPASHGGHHRREGSATAATAPCIEGVVDLSAVSQLVEGIDDEGELTKFLRRDFAESRASAFASPSSAAAVDSTSAAADAAFPALQPTIANYATNLETIQEGMQNHVRPMTSDFDDYDTAANISTEQLSESAMRLVKSGTDDYLNEEKPLLPSSSSSSSPKDDILASSGSPASVGPSTACLVVSADPFVQTLADVLEHVDNNKPNSVKGSLTSSSIERTSELHNGSVRFSSYTHGDGDDAAAAANSFMLHHYPSSLEDTPGGGIAVSSEAFLISMPTTTTTTTSTAATATAVVDGMTGVESDYGIHGSNYSNHSSTEYKYNNNNTAESVYILALPEIVISSKTSNDDADGEDDAASSSRQHHGGGNRTLRSSVTSIANTIATVTAEEIVATPFFENAFAPLPTDIRNIELRVSTAATTAYYDDGYNEKEDGWRTSAEGDDAAGGNDEGDYPSVHLDVVVDRCVPFVGYVLLVAGLLGLSSSGVAFDLQHGPSAEMKTLWRFVATTIAFLCLGSKAMTREELEKFSLVDLVFWVPLASVNYGFMCTAFVVALEMTSMVNTFILSNLASLIIIGSKFATGSPVLLLEGLGAAVGFAGALICAGAPSTEPPVPIAGDPNDGVGDDADNLEMTGNILAFLASVATAIYLTIAKNLRPKVDLFLFMTLLFAYSSIFLLIYMLLSGQPVKILSFHPTIGLFGWLHPALDRLPLEVYSALVCNGIGTAGFIAVMKYFDPVVVSMVMLMEPIFASFMGAATGVSTLPGWMTWLGDAVVVVGSIMVISSGAETTESIDATEALHGFEKGAAEDDAMVRGSTKSSLTRGSSLAKSPLEIRSVLSRRSGRYSMVGGGGGGRRAVVTTPRVFQSHSGEGVEEGGEGEVEFQSVKGKMRSSSIKSSGHRVVWN